MIVDIDLTVTNDPSQNALTILQNCRWSVFSFFDLYSTKRQDRKAKGTATDAEQDLLRAMLLFSSAGLDSLVKQLIKDALEPVIENDKGSAENFTKYVEKKISRKIDNDLEILDKKLITQALLSNSPRSELIGKLRYDLTSDSLQSKDQLFKIASYFNIESNKLFKDHKELEEIFSVRNQITHEMDVDLEPRNRNRRQRSKDSMVKFSNELLSIGQNFISEVDKKLK